MTLLLWIVIAIVAIIVIAFIYYYNRFVLLDNRIDNSLSQIDVQLKKRADLAPNLPNSAKERSAQLMRKSRFSRKNAKKTPAHQKWGDPDKRNRKVKVKAVKII